MEFVVAWGICMKAPIFLCYPTLNGLLGLDLSNKFSSLRMKFLIHWACLSSRLLVPVVMVRISRYQLTIKSNCHRTRNPVQIQKVLRLAKARNLVGQGSLTQGEKQVHGSRLSVQTSHVKYLWLSFSFFSSVSRELRSFFHHATWYVKDVLQKAFLKSATASRSVQQAQTTVYCVSKNKLTSIAVN